MDSESAAGIDGGITAIFSNAPGGSERARPIDRRRVAVVAVLVPVVVGTGKVVIVIAECGNGGRSRIGENAEIGQFVNASDGSRWPLIGTDVFGDGHLVGACIGRCTIWRSSVILSGDPTVCWMIAIEVGWICAWGCCTDKRLRVDTQVTIHIDLETEFPLVCRKRCEVICGGRHYIQIARSFRAFDAVGSKVGFGLSCIFNRIPKTSVGVETGGGFHLSGKRDLHLATKVGQIVAVSRLEHKNIVCLCFYRRQPSHHHRQHRDTA